MLDELNKFDEHRRAALVRLRASPGTVAELAIWRFRDRVPYERMERLFCDRSLPVTPVMIQTWLERFAAMLTPVIDAMWLDTCASPYLCVHATEHEACVDRWVVVAPDRHVIYAANRHGAVVSRMLADYTGYLLTDEQAVHEHLRPAAQGRRVGDWPAVRRHFLRALTTEPTQAREALTMIAQLFDRECQLVGLDRESLMQGRNAHSFAIVVQFFSWCERYQNIVGTDTPLARAIAYTRNHAMTLREFLRDPRVPLYERPTDTHALLQPCHVSTTFASLLTSCHMHGIAPGEYLRGLLCLCRNWPRHRMIELAPINWRATQQAAQTREALADTLAGWVTGGDPDHSLFGDWPAAIIEVA